MEKYNDDDKLLIAKVMDNIKFTKTKNKIELTDFLDERQQKLIITQLQKNNFNSYELFGGFQNAERKVIFFIPDKFQKIENIKSVFSNFIKCIKINLPRELFSKYSHRDYLSAIMKLGIKREKVGDILVFEDGAEILILDTISEYVFQNITQLTRFSKSKVEIINLNKLSIPIIKKEKFNIIVQSMRLDSVVSEICNTSRTIAGKLIEEERILLNYEIITKLSKDVKENDKLTVRGKGKFIIGKIISRTKKDRIIVEVEKYI